MKRIEDNSVNLIICDSPYFKICGGFDWAFKTMQEWIDWHILLRDEFERILADNGSLFVFGDENNIAYLQVEFDKKFNLLNNIVYRKLNPMTKGINNMFMFPPSTERILFYDKQKNKSFNQYLSQESFFEPIQTYLTQEKNRSGLSVKRITEIAGFKFCSRMTGHFFEKNQWHFPNKEHYEGLQKTGFFQKEYEELRKEYEELRKEYEDLRRPFNNQFKLTDVIDCKTQSSFHPTTKDRAVIEKLIMTTTKEEDLIFSPFLGSGTDRIAAHNTKRNIISCEIDKEYFDKAEFRYQEHIKQLTLF
jgi:site-specific DNA-methyltransferase (adenine-specific)